MLIKNCTIGTNFWIILQLKSSVNLSDTVKTINISESDNYVWGSLAAVSGWGYEQVCCNSGKEYLNQFEL